MQRCPGQDTRYWRAEDIFEVECSGCGNSIEFFKDEVSLKCKKCGRQIINPRLDTGCTKWCQYGKECMENRNNFDFGSIKELLIAEMKEVFRDDQPRIDHALEVLGYAEQIRAAEGGDAFIVVTGAILHDIGIHEAERKYGSSQSKYQEIEGPGIAREILQRHNIIETDIEHICKIIANHHSARYIDTLEFRIIWDADWLINFEEHYGEKTIETKVKVVEKIFKTKTGKKIASEKYLSKGSIFQGLK
jgi:HD superfamily phosphodiesterase/predicted RNA-binding Zn-ribbon protein involved in translation (DUF1610 family)